MALRSHLLMFFYQMRVKNDNSISKKIWLSEKVETFIAVFITIHWVKPGWPAKPILVILSLLMGLLLGDASKAGYDL